MEIIWTLVAVLIVAYVAGAVYFYKTSGQLSVALLWPLALIFGGAE